MGTHKYLCDYCGGSETQNENDFNWTFPSLHIEQDETQRNVCALCFIKVFDFVLGKYYSVWPQHQERIEKLPNFQKNHE